MKFILLFIYLAFSALAYPQERRIAVSVTPELREGVGVNIIALLKNGRTQESLVERVAKTTWAAKLSRTGKYTLRVVIPRISWKEEVLYEQLISDATPNSVSVKLKYGECEIPLEREILNKVERSPNAFLVHVKGIGADNSYYSYCGRLEIVNGRSIIVFPVAKSGRFSVQFINLSVKPSSLERIISKISTSVSIEQSERKR